MNVFASKPEKPGRDLRAPARRTPAVRGFPATRIPELAGDTGTPLRQPVRRDMEERFQHDFSKVRIHPEGAAADGARARGVLAYTVGTDVVFARGRFQPHRAEGVELLAHELAHVVQQNRGGGSPPGPPHEQDARAAAHAVRSGVAPRVRAGSRVGFAAQRASHKRTSHKRASHKGAAAGMTREHDYTLATRYIQDFYTDVGQCIDFAHEAERTAINAFTRTTTTQDAPRLGDQVAISLLDVGFHTLGGWTLVERGITRGIFARNIWAMKRALGEKIGQHAVETLTKLGPTERQAALGKALTAAAEHTSAAAVSVRKAAQHQAQTEAGRTTQAANQADQRSLVRWGRAHAIASQEKSIAEKHLERLYQEEAHGPYNLRARIKADLGPRPNVKAMGNKVAATAQHFELELYKRRFGPHSGARVVEDRGRMGVYSRTLQGPPGFGSWEQVVKRIYELKGWPWHENWLYRGHKHDLDVAALLHLPTVVNQIVESGKML